MRQRRKIKFVVDTIYIETKVTELVQLLKDYVKAHGPDLELEKDYDGGIQLVGFRPETDEEYYSRLAEEDKFKQLQEENQRRQYEQLKAKFGE